MVGDFVSAHAETVEESVNWLFLSSVRTPLVALHSKTHPSMQLAEHKTNSKETSD